MDKDDALTVKGYSEEFVRKHIDDLIAIDTEAFGKFSPPYDLWDLANFLYKLPHKEELSFFLYDPKKDIVAGYIIASSYGSCTHLNRVAVSRSYKGNSYGQELVKDFLDASKRLGFKDTTLSTLYDPKHEYVIKFYEKLGYKVLEKKEQISEFLRKKNKLDELESFYPLAEGKFMIMEKKL